MDKNKLYNNILDLCINQEIENSKNFLDLLYLELKICKVQMNFLEKEKPYKFQKKKFKAYLEEKKRLEERVEKYKKVIADELSLMAKLGE